MVTRKTARRALFSSAMALLLCFSMLLGTTFAWFTDTANAINNVITAGNLDVVLEVGTLKDGGQSANPNDWTWAEADPGKPVIALTNVEPGYVGTTALRVRNNGSLALKFALGTSIVSEKPGTNVAGESFNLSDNLYTFTSSSLSYTDWSRTAILTTIEQAVNDNFNSGFGPGTTNTGVNTFGETICSDMVLLQGQSAAFTFAVAMPASVGNEANHNGRDIPEITFGINVLATQHTFEHDSFGDQYDQESSFAELKYFDTLSAAMNAIRNNSVAEDGSDGMVNAAISVESTAKGHIVTLLKSVTETDTIHVTSPMTLVLHGYTVSFENTACGFLIAPDSKATVTIDAQVSGSAIQISNTGNSAAIEVSSGICEIKGGAYKAKTKDVGSKAAPNPCIKVGEAGSLYIKDAAVTAEDENRGTPNGIYVAKNGYASISNCEIKATAPYGLDVCGVNNSGTVDASTSDFLGYANYTANAAGTDYASNSKGVINSGSMSLVDCYVCGTQSGIASSGILLIDGGTYESYGHGGIYFSGSNTTSYVKDAAVRWSQMPDGYYDDGKAGTNGAGMYIGGGSGRKNIVVYMDNCELYGTQQSAVVRGSSGEKDDILYISNSRINTGAKIRVDGSNKLHIGSGNNFTRSHTRGGGTVETSNNSFRSVVDAAFQNK